MYYFNVNAGDWEPFLESFSLKVSQKQISEHKTYQEIYFDKPILINVSLQLLRILIDTQ